MVGFDYEPVSYWVDFFDSTDKAESEILCIEPESSTAPSIKYKIRDCIYDWYSVIDLLNWQHLQPA